MNIKLCIDDVNKLNFDIIRCPHGHTIIYKITINYIPYIKLIINDTIVETNVNTYINYDDEIIMSTIVKDEDDYIKQWIKYHLKLKITRFIIYDNSDNDNLLYLLNEYIINNIVILIKWNYPYRLLSTSPSGQITQQNHSIYAFNNSKYIGLFDIDEYINIQNFININAFFENFIIDNNININIISCFRLLNKFFYNPYNMATNDNNFLKIVNCDNITKSGHEKCFVIPKNVKTFSVHMVTDGLEMYNINEKYIFFNHYYFLNKKDRGKKLTKLIDGSILKVGIFL